MALLTLVISSPGSDCIKWERKQKKGGARCKHRPPPKMTHQQDLTKSRFLLTPWLIKKLFLVVQVKTPVMKDLTSATYPVKGFVGNHLLEGRSYVTTVFVTHCFPKGPGVPNGSNRP